jgi:hypothetical protein
MMNDSTLFALLGDNLPDGALKTILADVPHKNALRIALLKAAERVRVLFPESESVLDRIERETAAEVMSAHGDPVRARKERENAAEVAAERSRLDASIEQLLGAQHLCPPDPVPEAVPTERVRTFLA